MRSLIFLRSTDRPCVVHVIDPRLRSLPNYPLDKVMKHVEHNGPILGLLTVIASQGISVSAPKESGESATLRMRLPGTIKADDLTVRDALTKSAVNSRDF